MEYYQAPFTINRLGLLAVLHSIDDLVFVEKSAEMNKNERQVLYKELKHHGCNVVPSQSNFLHVYFDTVEERNHLYEELCSRNLLIRKTDLFGDKKAFR